MSVLMALISMTLFIIQTAIISFTCYVYFISFASLYSTTLILYYYTKSLLSSMHSNSLCQHGFLLVQWWGAIIIQVGQLCIFRSRVPQPRALQYYTKTSLSSEQSKESNRKLHPLSQITDPTALTYSYSYLPVLSSHEDSISIHSILSNSRNGGRSSVRRCN